MESNSSYGLQQFKDLVGIKFQLYNSLFISLPFHRIEKTGILLSLLLNHIEEGFQAEKTPVDMVEEFFERYTPIRNDKAKADLLFRFIQYVERQVVLFDALEDAAFKDVTDTNGPGTLKHLQSEILQRGKQKQLAKKLQRFCVRLVLTAHPTQFYPGSVLGIINDLSKALKEDNAKQVNLYLQQLGKTPFLKKQKPTPYDEAISLIWYLENVFYNAAGRIISILKGLMPEASAQIPPVIKMGFWPGGDRDGNPNVTTEITLRVADALRSSIIKCYYMDVRRLRRRLTFQDVDVILIELENKLYNNIFIPGQKTELTEQEITDALHKIRQIIIDQHNGLFVSMVENLINKVHLFGLHFASLDIRQESSVHNTVLEAVAQTEKILPSTYAESTGHEKMDLLARISSSISPEEFEDHLVKDTLASVAAIKTIREYNGKEGCNRYIISQCNSALNVLEVYSLFLLTGWQKKEIEIDIVPLFETIDDLKNARRIMETLYRNKMYSEHLAVRGKKQTIMVGFSDGTKDGGYLMANWSIYKAKEELTAVSQQHGIDVVFFDGRGGPPARGGGKTHKFYASMGNNIANKEIQLTIQGQTVSSNFGIVESAQYNMEQLLNAGISTDLFSTRERTLEKEEENLLQSLADHSFEAYRQLKDHPKFFDYLMQVTPINFYTETNIGSRPAKRGSASKPTLKTLRAIPFVGAWSQIKQNVPGFYGVGTALKILDDQGRIKDLKELYRQSLYFKTLMDNCEMAMKKSYFPLTAFLANDKTFGVIWNMIYDDYKLTKKYIAALSGNKELMANYPVDQLSIQMRERIVLPLTTIQQYGIQKIHYLNKTGATNNLQETFKKLVVRCSFGIINAGRNSV